MRGTLDSYIVDYIGKRRRRGEITQHSAANYTYALFSFSNSYADRPIDQLSRKAVERWLEEIGHLHPRTRDMYLSTVRKFCEWLVLEEVVKVNPTRGIQKIRQPRQLKRALHSSMIDKLLPVLPDTRAQVIVHAMLQEGLRAIEVSRLTVEDFDTGRNIIFVTGKGDHQRELPITDEFARILNQHLKKEDIRSGPVVRSQGTVAGPIQANRISKLVSDWMMEAGIKTRPRDGVSAHALRHTAATDVLERSGDLRAVQELLGHANISTTSIYVGKGDRGRLREAMEGRSYTA